MSTTTMDEIRVEDPAALLRRDPVQPEVIRVNDRVLIQGGAHDGRRGRVTVMNENTYTVELFNHGIQDIAREYCIATTTPVLDENGVLLYTRHGFFPPLTEHSDTESETVVAVAEEVVAEEVMDYGIYPSEENFILVFDLIAQLLSELHDGTVDDFFARFTGRVDYYRDHPGE
jgi:hypothetical protein